MPIQNPTTALVSMGHNVVHNGAGPGGWAVLDLSPVLGLRRAVVLLSFQVDVAVSDIRLRKDGEARAAGDVGCSGIDSIAAGDIGYAVIQTSPTGQIEWNGAAGATIIVTMLGYWAPR